LKKMARNSLEYSFADAATRGRLQAELDAAFVEFERTIHAPSRRPPDGQTPD
jgi:hypothetical protein